MKIKITTQDGQFEMNVDKSTVNMLVDFCLDKTPLDMKFGEDEFSQTILPAQIIQKVEEC